MNLPKKTLLALVLAATFQSAVAQESHFLTLADIHYLKGGPVVNYGDGDTGDILWANTQNQLQQRIQTDKPQFIVLLGDLPAHDDESRTVNLQSVLTSLSSTLKIPVFYVPGNNDSLGDDLMTGDYHSFSNGDGVNLFSLDKAASWPALNASSACATMQNTTSACLIDPQLKATAQFGYYAARPLGVANKLRLVVLNSVIFNKRYVSDDGVAQPLAASEQLAWFHAQLLAAQKMGDSVLIALHVPPGLDAYSGNSMWSDDLTAQSQFLADTVTFKDTIKGILYGHTHMDEFRRINGADDRLAVLASSTPGVTPGHYNSPSLKVFSYNAQFDLTDAQTYYTDPVHSENWHSYGAKAIYNCTKTTLFQCAADFSPVLDKDANAYQAHYAVDNAFFQPNYWPSIMAAIDIPLNSPSSVEQSVFSEALDALGQGDLGAWRY